MLRAYSRCIRASLAALCLRHWRQPPGTVAGTSCTCACYYTHTEREADTYLADERLLEKHISRSRVNREVIGAVQVDSWLYVVRYGVSLGVPGAHSNYTTSNGRVFRYEPFALKVEHGWRVVDEACCKITMCMCAREPKSNTKRYSILVERFSRLQAHFIASAKCFVHIGSCVHKILSLVPVLPGASAK